MADLDPTTPLTIEEIKRLHEIESNPLTDDDIEMFEMFEREGWDEARRTAYILDQIQARQGSQAAE